MRNRNIKINVFLNEEEKKIFDEKVKKSGLNKSEFFRKIILWKILWNTFFIKKYGKQFKPDGKNL